MFGERQREEGGANTKLGSAATEPGPGLGALRDISEGLAGTEWEAQWFEFWWDKHISPQSVTDEKESLT